MKSPQQTFEMRKGTCPKKIQLNEEAVKGELKELVRKSVEETLNELLDKEADELTGAGRYERTASRQGYRSGHYSRKLTTTSGEVRLEVPKLKGVPFELQLSSVTATERAASRKR